MSQKNCIEFKVSARHALFTDPLSKIGGEKCSYHIPTYEALKGIAKSIYWKPTFIWVIDEMRVMKRIRTQTKGTKPLVFSSGGSDLSIYTFLSNVEYQVRAHFEWNEHHPNLANDRIEGKHYAIARRMVERGGRQDVFLGTRDCQGYVEPSAFGAGSGELDSEGELAFGLMLHGFDYPDETGINALSARFWRPTMVSGHVNFIRPEACQIRKFVREMTAKKFGNHNVRNVHDDAAEMGALT